MSAPPGQRIIAASYAGSALIVIGAIAAVTSSAVRAAVLAMDLALFAGGVVVFFAAYAVAVGRSRTDAIGIGGLYFLSGSAPRRVQAALLGSLAVEVVTAVAAAATRPYTSVAFTILTPMWALGLAGLWAARHGTFASRRAGKETVPPRGSPHQ